MITALTRALAAGAAVAGCAAAGSPVAASPANLPSYATSEERIAGRIASFDGKYALQVRDDRGYLDAVTLHDGTIINPTGLRLAAGQSVTVLGHSAGKTFAANEVDTLYVKSGIPAYGYGPYDPYAYPAFGFGFGYRGYGYGRWGFRGWF